MEKMMSKKDVIVSRGIWYVLTLLSLFGLSTSLNLLWPHGDSSSSSQFLRDGAVSVTTFYAVTLLRYLFFTEPPSTCYKEFITTKERIAQVVFSQLYIAVLFQSPLWYSMLKTKVLYESFFTISLFTGGIGLIQLSDKFRMGIIHALFTLFSGWLFGLIGIFLGLYGEDYLKLTWFLTILYLCIFIWIFDYIDDFDSSPASPLPT